MLCDKSKLLKQILLLCLPGVILSQDNQTLTIQRVKKEDSGRYTCTACNRRGCDASQAFLTTEGQSVIWFLRGWLLLRKVPVMGLVVISLELIHICNVIFLYPAPNLCLTSMFFVVFTSFATVHESICKDDAVYDCLKKTT